VLGEDPLRQEHSLPEKLEKEFLNPDFVAETHKIRDYLSKIKYNLDEFDKTKPAEKEQIDKINSEKPSFFKMMNRHFEITTKFFDQLSNKDYQNYQNYYNEDDFLEFIVITYRHKRKTP